MAEVLVVVEASQGAGEEGHPRDAHARPRTGRAVGRRARRSRRRALVDRLGEYGAQKVYAAEHADLDGYLVAPKATVLAALVKRVAPAAVLLASTQEGKEIAGRLAVKLDNGLLTDVVTLGTDGPPPRSPSPARPSSSPRSPRACRWSPYGRTR